MKPIDLRDFGLSERFFQESLQYAGLHIARISYLNKGLYKAVTQHGEILAEIPGKYAYGVSGNSGYPAVGDFVMLDRTDNVNGNALIHHVLTRKSVFERKSAGTAHNVQVIAANIDTVFICMSLNSDFNARRLERYLAVAWSSGATPVVVLTKSDLCTDISSKCDAAAAAALGVDIVVTTGTRQAGWQPIRKYIQKGQTVAFIGSSGVGKSTLVNRLIGQEALATKEIRSDGKGRHATTSRHLIALPDGGVVIDTPGMRELGIIHADIATAFSDIHTLARQCRFKNCSHQAEPGCAVKQAIAAGTLDPERLKSYLKLRKEAKYNGLNARQIEKEKINAMFSGLGGIKNARKYIKEKKKI